MQDCARGAGDDNTRHALPNPLPATQNGAHYRILCTLASLLNAQKYKFYSAKGMAEGCD